MASFPFHLTAVSRNVAITTGEADEVQPAERSETGVNEETLGCF